LTRRLSRGDGRRTCMEPRKPHSGNTISRKRGENQKLFNQHKECGPVEETHRGGERKFEGWPEVETGCEHKGEVRNGSCWGGGQSPLALRKRKPLKSCNQGEGMWWYEGGEKHPPVSQGRGKTVLLDLLGKEHRGKNFCNRGEKGDRQIIKTSRPTLIQGGGEKTKRGGARRRGSW